jgi:hypothetical protein
LSIETSRAVPVGQNVTVIISLVFDDKAMSEPLPLRGRIVWCTAIAGGLYQIGVKFANLTGDERLYVELFLRYLTEEP